MLYLNKLENLTNKLKPVFEDLFKMVFNNQFHIGDLLLVYNNFSLNTKLPIPKGYSPYIMGHGFEGFSELTHYKFIDLYRKNMISENNTKEIPDSLKKFSIQIEMLIYLKIWESDLFIKKLYQIARLLNGKSYDWNFKISIDNKDKKATGTRQKIIREKIRDQFKIHSPILYEIFRDSYSPQIRNAIAHSQYYFLENVIGLNNYDPKSKYSSIPSISFDNWSERFHETMIVYNEYILFINRINKHYITISKKQNNRIPFIIKIDSDKSKNYHLEYILEKKRWQWMD